MAVTTEKLGGKVERIVRQQPTEVAKLLYDKGYEPPKRKEDLVRAVKELLRLQGNRFRNELRGLEKKKFSGYDEESYSEESPKSSCACGGKCKGKSVAQESSFCGCGVSSFSPEGEKDKSEAATQSKSTKTEEFSLLKHIQKTVTLENALTFGVILFTGFLIGRAVTVKAV